jgi:hypothetical protein
MRARSGTGSPAIGPTASATCRSATRTDSSWGPSGSSRCSLRRTTFVPGVVYLADAVGTQTEALVIRGLSIGVGIREVAIRELVTGILAGVILGGLFLPIGLLIWG